MASFLAAAYKVLSELKEPMTAQDITEAATSHGWLSSSGKTPPQTMKSKLSTDILRNKDKSLFMRTDKGTFALRAWKGDVPEYTADRYQKALLDEDAVVFPRSSLSKYLPSTGLHLAPLEDGFGLLDECRPMLRRQAEEDPTVIQLVSAFVVRCKDRYLTYKRTKRLPEKRLHDQYSAIFGGHLTPDDISPHDSPLWTIFDPENGHILLSRELSEEVRFPGTHYQFVYKGILYDDTVALSRQHLGIVYDVQLDSPEYEIGERGFLIDPKFETLEEMEARIRDFENWSALLIAYERHRRSLRNSQGLESSFGH